MSNVPSFLEPVEETFTEWKNPLEVPQHVDIFHDGALRPTRYKWAPGESKMVPSRYDRAIHRVENGVIIAGLAPQLVKVGSDEKLDPALDTTARAKKEALIEAERAAQAKKAADDAVLLAAARNAEADKAVATKAEESPMALPPEAAKKQKG